MVILGGLDVHRAQITYDYLDTVTLRGRKKRAKTDRADARHLRQLLVDERLPESWIAP
ncbi:hypothetical protein BMS3Abin02_01831 [bacterium BMS3Abin02]|nr:hypothetical protein BMS3Abin02_01831 [bacterium BMS3Abin02]